MIKKRFFRLEANDLFQAADDFVAARLDVEQARMRYVDDMNASGYVGSRWGIDGLKFEGAAPKGWVPLPGMPNAWRPNEKSTKGLQALVLMRAQTFAMPEPRKLSGLIGFEPMFKVTPQYGLVSVDVQKLDNEYVVTVPTFEQDDISLNPSLAWSPRGGMIEVLERDFVAQRRTAVSRGARPTI
jgi:hypothetical protein